jgi:hypothetical protein
MAHQYTSNRKIESEALPGVTFWVRKLTEGRRAALRAKLAEPNKKIRQIMRQQSELEKTPIEERDTAAWLELDDDFNSILIDINSLYIFWGLSKIEGLEVDGKPLGVEDAADFPSNLFAEIMDRVKEEMELSGAETKNSSSLPTSQGQVATEGTSGTAQSAEEKAGTGNGTVANIIPIM